MDLLKNDDIKFAWDRKEDNAFNLCHGKAGIAAINMILYDSGKELIERILSDLCDTSTTLSDLLNSQEQMNYGLLAGITGTGFLLLATKAEMGTILTGDISMMERGKFLIRSEIQHIKPFL